MGCSIKEYQAATAQFLKCFDIHWNEMLEELDTHQSQMISGNRLRPQIVLWGYLSTIAPNDVAAHNFNTIANIAVSIEMIHKASLLLDDWIDADTERHGHPAFHVEYGSEYTVLLALNMVSLATFRLKRTFPESAILPQHYYLCLEALIKTINAMAKGALKELKLEKNQLFDSQIVQEIVQLETAEVLGNSMLLGYYAGVRNGPDKKAEDVFKKQGDQCGYLFQALNDLEAFENPQLLKIHKGTLNFDIFSNRKNLVVSSLYEIANKKDRSRLQEADEAELIRLIKKYRIIEMIKFELNNVYDDILSAGTTLQSLGFSLEWCNGLRWFLGRVKGYAEERLKEPETLGEWSPLPPQN